MTTATLPTSAITLKSMQVPADLPEAEVVRDLLRSYSVIPENYESEMESAVSWEFVSNSTLPDEIFGLFSVIVTIYRPEDSTEDFIWMEAALCSTAGREQDLPKIMKWMLQHNYVLFHPFRLCLNPQGLVIAQFRSYLGGISQDGLKTRLDTLIPFSSMVMKELQERFSLCPLVGA